MTDVLTADDTRRLRLRAQRLTGVDGKLVPTVEAVCGVQAQDRTAAFLGVRARCPGTTAADVERALYEDRSIVRTWAMRGTLQLLAVEDLPWLLSLFGPLFASRGPEPKRLAEMGIDEDAIEAAAETLDDVFAASGPLTLAELTDRLAERGIDLTGQAPNFLVRRATLRGVVCEVEPIGGKNAYDRLDAWLPDAAAALGHSSAPEGEHERLAGRYLDAHGPATLTDFCSWSGLLKTTGRTAWESLAESGGVESVTVDGVRMLVRSEALDDTDDEAGVRLLPAYDHALLGYAPENRPLPERYRERVWPGGGVIRPTVMADGAVVGTWRLDRSRATPVVEVAPFEPLDDGTFAGVETEAADVGRFLAFDSCPEIRVVD